MTCVRLGAQVYKPLDRIGLYGQDPGNDLQGEGTYYCVAGHSGQGACRLRHLLPSMRPCASARALRLQCTQCCMLGPGCVGVARGSAAEVQAT